MPVEQITTHPWLTAHYNDGKRAQASEQISLMTIALRSMQKCSNASRVQQDTSMVIDSFLTENNENILPPFYYLNSWYFPNILPHLVQSSSGCRWLFSLKLNSLVTELCSHKNKTESTTAVFTISMSHMICKISGGHDENFTTRELWVKVVKSQLFEM